MRKQRRRSTADHRLCFRYVDSTIPLLSKSKISSFYPSSVVVQPGLCRTWSETPKTGFLTTRLIFSSVKVVERPDSGKELLILFTDHAHDIAAEEIRCVFDDI